MRGGALPPALLCAALGLALSFAPRRTVVACLIVLVIVATLSTRLTVEPMSRDVIFLACWTSLAVTAAAVHLPRGLSPPVAIALSVNAGVWSGAVVASAGDASDLLQALPLSLLCVPGLWLVATRRQIAIKVAASWLIAVACLAATLQTIPTPGYMSDHMD